MAGSVPGSFIVLAVRMWSAAETSSVDSIRQKEGWRSGDTLTVYDIKARWFPIGLLAR
ncbi:hypothetical protein RvVAR0630_04080 [Agrobacterium vitis]|nr:hypothetical protein RvVAR0630_04080 [Agrobacterium vitis]